MTELEVCRHTSLAETAKTDPQKAVVTAVLQKEEQSAEEMLDSEARGEGVASFSTKAFFRC